MEFNEKMALFNAYRQAKQEFNEADGFFDKETVRALRKAMNDAYNAFVEADNEITGFVEVILDNLTVLLPIGQKVWSIKKNGDFNQSKFNIFTNDIHTLLNQSFIQSLPISQKRSLFKVILETEQYEPSTDILEVDAKLRGLNWACMNSDTGITCPNRCNHRCKFAEHCYAFKGCRNPSTLKKQLAKALFFYENDAEALAKAIELKGSPVVRINQEGELNTLDDYLKCLEVAKKLPNVFFYAYTKNTEVLAYIEANGLLNNVNVKDSTGKTKDNHYLAVPSELRQYYLDLGYYECFGKCDKCKACQKQHLNIFTILRT